MKRSLVKRFVFSIVTTLLIISGCGKTQQVIEYGEDNCHWCQMRIMDPKFGTEAITEKGRCYKFDSSECLLHYLHEVDTDHSHLYVTDFERPETLIDAKSAFYLVSEEMPSPMGGNLNAFSTKLAADKYQKKNGGEVFDWSGIVAEYQK